MSNLIDFKDLQDFKSLKIRLASSSEMRSWSHGEITKPETINYRTLKPEKDGLFDERIFGPTKDFECYCGKYKRIRYKGVVCDKCGVEVTESRVRRERMGHISLAAPVVHVWYFKGAPSKVSLLLGLAPRSIDQVVYFAKYLVISVDEEKRKEAVSNLKKARDERIKEIKETFSERRTIAKQEFEAQVEEAKRKLKDDEQLALTMSEIEVEERKKGKAIDEEEAKALGRSEELFTTLANLAKTIEQFSFLSEEEYDELSFHGASAFINAKMGAEALKAAIEKVDINKIVEEVREDLADTKRKSARYTKLAKRLKIVEGMRDAKVDPSWMILDVIPVLPPDLRPMVQLSGGRFAASDLNDLYRRVINRNNRLKHLITLGAPEIILRNEKRMLQESVDSLIDSSQRKATRRGRGRQPLRSLSDMLKGKQGRFRQNLLGKRVDYSGRSVIVVGPELKLNQCGIPKDMALEMFKPFVLREMISRGIAPNVKSAKNLLERRPSEVFDILEEITQNHPVLLNRAPTLHKLGIQAFYPVLVEGSAIRVHPAVCSGFNADFDGDQMAVHIPLSKFAIDEAKEKMLSQNNLLRPADGSPIAAPSSKEMALGVFYLTSIDTRIPESETVYSDIDEALLANQTGHVELRQGITVRMDGKSVETTVGRIVFNKALGEGFEFVNKPVDSGAIKEIVVKAFASGDNQKVANLIDAVKNVGFYGGTISGLSFGVFDARVLPQKDELIENANKRVSEIEGNFNHGLITSEEKRRLSQEVWIETTEEIADKTWEMVEPESSIKVVIDAKVGRASRDQVKQLAGMRGLVVDPLGKIVELPIKGNFREGLSVFEYVTSSRGSRKGLTDTALKTADAGYLTRRLVDVAHDMLIREKDCGTERGYVISRSVRPQVFAKRIIGRFAAKDVKKGKTILVKAGEIIDEKTSQKIAQSAAVTEVAVFSPITCQTRYGLCQKCYGWDLSFKKLVEIGTPVGVVAAQSVGEPGTQLTLRTKHTGGVVGVDVTQGLPRVEELFEARTPKVLSPISEISGKVFVSEEHDGWKVRVLGRSGKQKEEREYIIPKTSKLFVSQGQTVEAGSQLASGFLDIKDVLAIRGLEEAQRYLVHELQAVYESQGIPINDKHFEALVKKMSDEVKINSTGDTNFLPGEITDKGKFEEENERVLAEGGEPASARQIVLGVTRRALYTQSWLSAASFEQTTGVLTEASLLGRVDRLLGLKENVIIGRLIPVTEETMLRSGGIGK